MARLWTSWECLERALPSLGEPFSFSADAERVLWDVRFAPRSVLVFGREGVGLSAEIRHRYRDRLVRIPMVDPELRSLNLSTCVGIAVFEALRQRDRGGAV